MRGSTRLLVGIWLLTTLLVLVGALLLYRNLTRVPLLAGRTDPTWLYENPLLLFEDPGILGSAVELRVTEAVDACMEAEGLSYRGPAVVDDLAGLLGQDAGYGVATGPEPPGVELGTGGPQPSSRDAYERALYGSALDDATRNSGCAAIGIQQLESSVAILNSLPYPIGELEADILAHPASDEALRAWSSCIAERGYEAESPLDLISAQAARLASVRGDQARRLADVERTIAAIDRRCRQFTLDRVLADVAEDLAPTFVERNQASLQILIPSSVQDPDLGTGDVQVTLRWASPVDLDLQIVDPDGADINYSTRTSPSGGELDRDANYPCSTASAAPVENIFWPVGSAPDGSYRVEVVYQRSCDDLGPQTFELVVRIGGREVLRAAERIESGSTQTFEFDFHS